MNYLFLDHTLTEWLLAAVAGLAALLGMFLARSIVGRRLGAWAARTATRYDDLLVHVIQGTHGALMTALAIPVASTMLHLSVPARTAMNRLAIGALLVQAALWADRGLRAWLTAYRLSTDDPARATSTAALGFILRILIWVVAVLMILDNLGFNITTLVASLGIGGVAVALAVQNILGDLFASLSIVLDKPFVIGDFIVVEDMAGTVEYVGLKTTRIRSLAGEQIVYANAKLLGSRIHNLKRMETRRVAFTVGVVYGTPTQQLRAVPALIEAAIRGQAQVRFDRAHFSRLGPSSLDFEVVYFVENADYLVFMNVQQEIYLALYDSFREQGIDFAFPTQTLHLASVPEQAKT